MCEKDFFRFNSRIWRWYETKSRRGKATKITMASCKNGLLIKFVAVFQSAKKGLWKR